MTLDSEQQIEAFAADGEEIEGGKVIARTTGFADILLAGERVALNLLQRLSGIATLTNQFVKAVEGTSAVIVDTRKTTPGLRMLEKYAVQLGGGIAGPGSAAAIEAPPNTTPPALTNPTSALRRVRPDTNMTAP